MQHLLIFSYYSRNTILFLHHSINSAICLGRCEEYQQSKGLGIRVFKGLGCYLEMGRVWKGLGFGKELGVLWVCYV